MDTYGSGSKAWMGFMAAVLAAFMAGCGGGDEIFGTGGLGGGSPPPPGAAPVLGTLAGFGGMSGGGTAGMTNQGTLTQINGGDMGTTATATSSVTGFHDSAGDIYTETPANIGAVSGLIYSCTVSTTGPTSAINGGPNAASCATATQALADAQAAYIALSPAAQPGGINPGANLSGLTLAPGIYTAPAGSFLIENNSVDPAGDLTLDGQGNANAVWVFQMPSSTLTVGGPGAAFPRSVNCVNGCQPKNVFWYVGSSATINAAGGGTMVGTIIASDAISFGTPTASPVTTLNGRAMALNASVTLVNTVINIPAP